MLFLSLFFPIFAVLKYEIVWSGFAKVNADVYPLIYINDSSSLTLYGCSFSSIESNLESACVEANSNTVKAYFLSYATLRTQHQMGSVKGGSAMTLLSSNQFDIKGVTLFDTNTNERMMHSSILLNDCLGKMRNVNQSRTSSQSTGKCCRGICFRLSTVCDLAEVIFFDCQGGNSIFFEYKVGKKMNCKNIVFANISADEGYLIDYDDGSTVLSDKPPSYSYSNY